MTSAPLVLAVVIGGGAILSPPVVWAQPPAAPPAAPAATPKTYPPRPPRSSAPAPFEYPFAPMPGEVAGQAPPAPARDLSGFNLTLALGPGGLNGPGERALALGYQLRVGYGIDRNLVILVGLEGAGTNSVNPKTQAKSWLKQEMVWLGLMGRLGRTAYLRTGVGVAAVSEKTDTMTFEGGNGLAVVGAVGWDIYESGPVALAIELAASHAHYAVESWQTFGLQVAVSLF